MFSHLTPRRTPEIARGTSEIPGRLRSIAALAWKGPVCLALLLLPAWVGSVGCYRSGANKPVVASSNSGQADPTESPNDGAPSNDAGTASDDAGSDKRGAGDGKPGGGDGTEAREPESTPVDEPESIEAVEQAQAELERDDEAFVVSVAISQDSLAELLPKLAGFPRLSKLSLAGSQVTSADLESLTAIASLRELDLFDTDLDDDKISALSKLSGLQRLSLSGTRITDAALTGLAKLRELQELDLRWTDITGESIDKLVTLPNLTKLDLSWTVISDKQIERLAKLASIQNLVLENTEFTDRGLEKLRTAMANSKIVARDDVAAAIRAGSSRDYRLVGAGVGDRYRIMAQEYQQSRNEFLNRYGSATTEPQRAEIAKQPPSARPIAERMMKLADENPDHPAAIDALSWIVRADERFVQDLQKLAAARLIQQYADDPKLGEACLRMSMDAGDPAQRLLRSVKDKSSVKEIRGRAAFALADSLDASAERARQVQAMDEPTRSRTIHLEGLLAVGQLLDAKPAELLAEAEQLFAEVQRDYADVEGFDATLGERAKSRLFELRTLAVGNEAPDIGGNDLDGEPLHLKEYRGKVVVLTFWGNWCGPCRAMYPHERELVERLEDKPFVLLGVNSDRDRNQLRLVMEQEGITWRSWWDGGSTRGPIARLWNVDRWPTIYVLDHQGVIRFKNIRGDALDEAVDQLIAQMEQDAK